MITGLTSEKVKNIVAGIDEAGRGPLAGPVVACAFAILDTKYLIQNTGVRDSKLLSPRQRTLIYQKLRLNHDVEWGIGQVSETQIDKINILQATRLAMKKAVLSLERKLRKRADSSLLHNFYDRTHYAIPSIIDYLIVDGTALLDLPISQKAVVKADATIFSCMAASIIAKVTRDRLMLGYHRLYPLYGFDRHKGYGTKSHFEALARFGPCAIHRRSFSPIRDSNPNK